MFWRLPQHGEQATVWRYGGTVTTKAQLLSEIAPLEAALRSLPRKTLGIIFCRNHPAALTLYLAALRTGHAVMLSAADSPAAHWETLRERYRPDWFLTADDRQCNGYIPKAAGQGWKWHVAAQDTALDIHPDLTLLLPTSGSTGHPQTVRLSYDNLADNAAAIAESLALQATDCAITSLPIQYSYGLSVVNSLLHAGGSLVLTDASVMQPEFWQAMTEGVTHLAGVPAQYQMLRRLGIEKRAPSSLRILTQAGGKLPSEDAAHFAAIAEEKGWRFHLMYGQTEATARIACTPDGAAKHAPDSIGVPIGNGRLEQDADTGELLYHGRNVMLGYAESADDLAHGDLLHGTLRTGDTGYPGEDGLWRITGRLKRFLKLSGLRINLQTVEDALREHFRIACACGGDDTQLAVWIEGEEAAVPRADISAHLFSRFHIHPTLLQVHYLDALPLNHNGKTDYARLQAEAR